MVFFTHPDSADLGGRLGGRLQLVAKRAVITALQTALLALALPSFDQVLQTTGSFHCLRATFRASLVALHPQLVLALARDRKLRELVLNTWSHCILWQTYEIRPSHSCLAFDRETVSMFKPDVTEFFGQNVEAFMPSPALTGPQSLTTVTSSPR